MVLEKRSSYEEETQRLNGNIQDGSMYGGTSSLRSEGLEPVTLTWENISIWAPKPDQGCRGACFRGSPTEDGTAKQILCDVSGIVRPGELLAVMGASGAGKTTLLNHLTSQGARLKSTGEVRVNGKQIGKDIRHISAYVQQDDLFVGSLTVREHLLFQAQLRIDEHVALAVRKQRVEEVMNELQLGSLADTRIGKPGQPKALSGGERKRLSFASEVITNPALMFCDEPTSGLDSFMAQMVVETLRSMASRGRTILCTIHQPSSEVYALMDRILFMAEGSVAYIGDTTSALKFFSGVGYACPANHNPGDFFIHTLAVIPGKEEKCRERIREICNKYLDSTVYEETRGAIAKATRKDKFVMDMDNVRDKYGKNAFLTSGEEDGNEEDEMKLKYKSSWWKQFRLLFWRTWVSNARNPAINRARLIQAIIIALIVGVIYWQQVYDQKGIMNIDGALFLLELQLTYGNLFMVVNSFPAEYPLFKREYYNGIYRVNPYYLSHILAEIPTFILVPFIMSLITYWMVGLYPTALAFFTYVGILTLMSMTTVAFGHLLSTMTVNVTLGVALAPVFVNPLMFFGGYFLNTDSVPWYVKPLEWLSWFSYANEMLVVNQWKNVDRLICEYAHPIYETFNGTTTIVGLDVSMCFTDGMAVIESFSFDVNNMAKDAVCLFLLALAFELLAYFFLYLRSKQRT